MKTSTMMTSAMPRAPVGKAWKKCLRRFDRFCLAAGIETLGAMMEARRRGGMWATAFAQAESARSSLGAHAGQDRFPRWQGRNRAASGTRAQRQRTATGKLGAGCPRRGLARRVGDEPDADQRVDAQSTRRAVRLPEETFRRRREAGCRSRRPRATSSRSRPHACRSGWPLTCPSSTCW